MSNKLSDMQKFIKLFDFKHKALNYPPREMFKVNDVDAQKTVAQNIINHHQFDLRIVSTGEMAAYNAFEVWEGKP